MVNFDINKTLNDLEGNTLIQIDYKSSLVRKCLELRNKKLSDLNAEDLRIMIGQNISLNYLIPIALEVLANKPFAEGNLYIGDLLEQVLRVETEFWQENIKLRNELDEIVVNVKSVFDTLLPAIVDYQSRDDNK